MIGLLKNKSQYYTEKNLLLVRDGVLCPRIFAIHSINFTFIIQEVHRCGESGSMRACHAAGPGSIPGRDRFPR